MTVFKKTYSHGQKENVLRSRKLKDTTYPFVALIAIEYHGALIAAKQQKSSGNRSLTTNSLGIVFSTKCPAKHHWTFLDKSWNK